jgi:hypothetical protein
MDRDVHVERPGHCPACAARLERVEARIAALEPPPGYRPVFALDRANLACGYAQLCIFCGHPDAQHPVDGCPAVTP